MDERTIIIYIQDLDISDRSKNALMRMKIPTLNELEKRNRGDISAVTGIGEDSIQELLELLEHVDEIFYKFEVRKQRINEIFDSVKDFLIDEIPFSSRALNALKRAGIFKVSDLICMSQKDIMGLHNVGVLTRTDITTAIEAIIAEGVKYFSHPHLSDNNNGDENDISDEERVGRIEQVVAEVGYITIEDLPLGTRACNALKAANISTVGELLHMTEKDFSGLRNVGNLTKKEILTLVENIIMLGSAYFTDDDTDILETALAVETPVLSSRGKGFDFSVIDILSKKFLFKPVRMTEWFGLSRQAIYNALEKRSPKRREIWTGKQLLEYEHSILRTLIQERKFDYTDEQVICCCMNNRQDDLACLFIYDAEIKCFFLKDLPEDLQREIVAVNYHKYTERELASEAEGKIVYIIRKPFFFPTYPDKFRANAQLRGMTSDEYALFISGCPAGDQRSVTDDQITAFFDENLVDGKVYISSDPKNQWIRSLASRNGYTIKEFIELFGYESRMDGTELTTDGARERHVEELKQCVIHDNVIYFPTDSHIYKVINTYCYNKGYVLNDYIKSLGFERTTERPDVARDVLEQDMQVRQSDGKFEDKVFASYPLIGSKIIKPEILDRLNAYTRKYIDTVLREPYTKLTLRAEMQITLALINNAKNWKNEENSNFWNYISLQFGYRDASGAVVRLLQSSLENAMKKNGRLFIEDSSGRAFKSTAVIHALTTRKSWMALFDFLFDFYKNNLNWKVIPNDPLLAVMIRALQQKLTGDGTEDTELMISSRVYSFQEGIRKLVIFRPVFTRDLFEKLITKIDAMVNSEDVPAKTYEEQLCEAWFKEKITVIASTKRTERQNQGGNRDVAIDYSRIHAKYILKNETDIQIVLPDIRLKREDISRAVLEVYYNGSLSLQQNMSWYGNELGKTLNGVTVSLPVLSLDAEIAKVQVKITCDSEEIYNSENTMNRREWVFYGGNECNVSQIKKDNYTIVLPRTVLLETENTEITEIDGFRNPGLQAFFLELKDGYVLTVGGSIIVFDSENGTDIRVMAPSESVGLPCVSADDQEYYFAYQNSVCTIILGNADFLQQFVILRNGEKIEFSSLPVSDNGLAFTFPLTSESGTCRLQVINLADERLVFDRSFILIRKANCSFNREFYYSLVDYQNAEYRANIDDFSEIISFGMDDEEVRIPYRNGELHVAIPKVEIQETTGSWMDGSVPAWYIGDIPQTSLLKVSTPSKLDVRFFIGGKDIMYDGQGLVTLGNALQSFCSAGEFSIADVVMKINGIKQNSTYLIARVCYKERFLGEPEFWTEEQKLYWNQGGIFIGKKNRKFTLSLLYGETATPIEFQLDENTEYVEIPADMPIGNYRYEISILSGTLFKKVKEVIAEGDCIVGDENLLRFQNRRIVIDAITDGFNEGVGRITIKTCYIDKIEFQGMGDTSEGYCPVYSGVMYTIGYHGERYDFSFDNHTNKRGVTKMMVNPVRIVYIGDIALCITDSDGDGLYYYHYYDKYSENTVYALTDHEYTRQNKHKYANADLYSYRTERI